MDDNKKLLLVSGDYEKIYRAAMKYIAIYESISQFKDNIFDKFDECDSNCLDFHAKDLYDKITVNLK